MQMKPTVEALPTLHIDEAVVASLKGQDCKTPCKAPFAAGQFRLSLTVTLVHSAIPSGSTLTILLPHPSSNRP